KKHYAAEQSGFCLKRRGDEHLPFFRHQPGLDGGGSPDQRGIHGSGASVGHGGLYEACLGTGLFSVLIKMMTTSEIIKRVRRIEIKTRGLSNHIFSGEYQAAFKGRGMSFSEVREYSPGDDVKTIDWNVTARFSHPYVKIFEEERELTLMLLVDISPSSWFGTRMRTKRELITE